MPPQPRAGTQEELKAGVEQVDYGAYSRLPPGLPAAASQRSATARWGDVFSPSTKRFPQKKGNIHSNSSNGAEPQRTHLDQTAATPAHPLTDHQRQTIHSELPGEDPWFSLRLYISSARRLQ